ncbi:synergin gamma-like isoform X2 [Mya arenaria]|uniref:synergin gamma-like isoform X2 n=1 Tax=Mya arenaria TaxID=6604 RepID=UPI0022E136A2|nr:synergin gamma-like isoform X2 [Mya arenaria]
MNPNMRPPGFMPSGPQQMMMPQGNMMNTQMPMMAAPVMNNQMAGMRMRPNVAPPSYNQALNQSQQAYMRPPGQQRVRPNTGQGRPSEKEKYFMQQQAKLKQFGKAGASASSLDPTKLVDSVFGTSSTPKPSPPKPTASSVDDGFGDFLGGPSTSGNLNPTGNIVSSHQGNIAPARGLTEVMGQPGVQGPSTGNTSHAPATIATSPTSKTQTKDLTKMMMESCDLTAPSKTQGFQKRTLREIDPMEQPHVGPHMHQASRCARTWNDSEELTQLFSSEEIKQREAAQRRVVKAQPPRQRRLSRPPAWLTESTQQHPIYRQVHEACSVDGEISTERLYPILMMSGLHKELLGRLWGICNRVTPGQLTELELTQLLAVIALTQNNMMVETVEMLFQVPQCPVPFLQAGGPQPSGPTPSEPGTSNVAQHAHVTSVSSQSAPMLGTGSVAQPAPPQSGPLFQGTSGMLAMPGFVNTGVLAHSAGMPMSTPNNSQPVMSQETSTLVAGPQMHHTQVGLTTSFHGNQSSAPATLTVTQLPTGGVTPGGSSNVVDDDDFADFQAAPPTLQTQTTPQKPPERLGASVQTTARSVGVGMSPEHLKSSTVESFFGMGSDDSSETASPDDDYFDGYKSADSKPSDSTFSTDQSDNDDFRNFENYLDEFQKKKEDQDKESPLHRPISKHVSKATPGNTPTPPKIAPLPLKSQTPQQGNIGMNQQINKRPVVPQVVPKQPSTDDDFADFHSAPFPSTANASANKTATPVRDLIGDEDKYAELRMLDFSTELSAPTTETEVVSTAPDDGDDGWADFSASPANSTDNAAISSTGHSKNSAALMDAPATGSSSTLGIMPDNTLPSGGSGHSSVNHDLSQNAGNTITDEGDWADFQDFNSSAPVSNNPPSESTQQASGSDMVNVKKNKLNPDEILGLFKMKADPAPTVKSRDDDYTPQLVQDSGPIETTSSVCMERLHGIPKSASTPEVLESRTPSDVKTLEPDDDHLFGPPPMDDFGEEENDDYSRGYDFDDFMKHNNEEKKKMYGLYGANNTFVVSGHKKTTGDLSKSKSTGELKSKASDPNLHESDYDSDSVASKDFDLFKGKLGISQHKEDSQSVASLEFISNKNIQGVKGDDSQSQSSNECVGTEGSVDGKEIIPPSKSLDSLDLRKEEEVSSDGQDNASLGKPSGQDGEQNGSAGGQVAWDVESTVEKGVEVEVASSLPVLGDRYSAILPPEPSSGDKPSLEWGRCLDSCLRMICQTNDVFNSISSSDVCNEVIASQQGAEYIEGVIEIYRVVCKITEAIKKTGMGNEKLGGMLKEIDLAWNNLTAFLVGGSVMPDPASLDYSGCYDEAASCGLCLLSVERGKSGALAMLSYAGNQYHTSCANFWINCVDSCLPALKPPQLL